MNIIENQTFDEERALYHLQNATVKNCVFAGPADGESAMKESRDIAVENCRFSLRYPLWHTHGFRLLGCDMDEKTRAAIWYATDGDIKRSRLGGIKCLRECADIRLADTDVVSPECGWRCRRMTFDNCRIESEYFLFECDTAELGDISMKGKYSFQYTKDITVKNANLDTKDAFWHSKNVTVEDSVIKGEYLGWYSEGLTLVRCRIIGTQPLCYCDNLTLVDCTMESTDLSFEYSEVNATVRGHIDSVKNPRAGTIVADSIGEIIRENAVIETDCTITTTL